VGPFRVADLGRRALVEDLTTRALAHAGTRPTIAFALHVGGLNCRGDPAFVRAMRHADVVYADGGSAVLVARCAGAHDIERAPTTDVGWDLLWALNERLGRRVRIALVGGPCGLADRAAQVLGRGCSAVPVVAEHGYWTDWRPVLDRVSAADPDVVAVGLGVPTEMVWVDTHRAHLPACLVLTCGGWFGHLAGEERRAPAPLRRPGVEWVARVAQSPRRLAPRYARGALSTAVLCAAAVAGRVLVSA
jgi:N-acetylglucosaminyldiphosphoundecaprenol N-acetyl-beta-D-mannosaminyltransferase